MVGRLLISSQTRRSPQGEVGPGNGTLLHRTAAGFTSTGIPDDFVVLCQLIAPCRRCPHRYAGGLSPLRSGSIRYLFIRSRFSHSVACIASLAGRLRFAPAPSRGRSPFRAWPLMVVSSLSCSVISTGELNPIYNVPMLGTHKPSHPSPLRQLDCCQLDLEGWMD